MSYSSKLTIEHFGNDMNLLKSSEIDLEYQGKERYFEFIMQYDEELYLFTSFKNQKLKKNFLFYEKINKNTLQPTKDLTKIAEIDYSGKTKYNAGNFGYTLSRDQSKLMIYYNLPYTKGDREKFGVHLFDLGMKPMWEKEITLPYVEELFDIEQYRIDNKGNFHLLGKMFKDGRKEKKGGVSNYKYQILSYYDDGRVFEEYAVDIGDKFLTDMQIAIDDDQNIICAGFYSNVGTQNIVGSYFLSVDKASKKILIKNFLST